jgi:hypothetical protein
MLFYYLTIYGLFKVVPVNVYVNCVFGLNHASVFDRRKLNYFNVHNVICSLYAI